MDEWLQETLCSEMDFQLKGEIMDHYQEIRLLEAGRMTDGVAELLERLPPAAVDRLVRKLAAD